MEAPMKRLLKWIGYIVGGLVAIVVVFIAVVYVITSSRMGRTYPTEVEVVAIPADSAAIERGHHLVLAVGECSNCHGDNLAGKLAEDNLLFARLANTNLTRGKGGVGATFSDADYVRSIRYGVRRDGKPVIFMPSEAFNNFSDSDLGAIIAYIKTMPPVDATYPPPRIGPIARVLSLMADFLLVPAAKIDRKTSRAAPVEVGVTKEYGNYLMKAGGCMSCHNPNLSGGAKIEGIPAANLTPTGIGKWSEADFMKVLRMGVRPDGRILSAVMPWPYTKNLTDDEIRAMWMYVQTVSPRPTGG
jgi:mono/diheme cytochrome c family protein